MPLFRAGGRLGLVLGCVAAVLLLLPAGPVLAGGSAGGAGLSRVAVDGASSGPSWVSVPAVAGANPLLRYSAGLAYDPVDSYSVLFGGCNRHLCPLGDTWKYEAGNWTNLTATLASSPGARQGEVLVDDAADGYLLLFGGLGPQGVLGDTWRFSAGAWAPIPVSGPSPAARAFAQATYDPVRGAVVLFGGIAANGSRLADTWAYSSGVWTNLTSRFALSPPARAQGALAFDPTDGFAVLFGGTGMCGSVCGDTWALGSQAWTNLTGSLSTSPAPRDNTTLTFDTVRAGLVLFGGLGSAALSDTWTFADGAWAALSANLSTSPGARYAASATYDSGAGNLLLYGGIVGASRSTTWLLLSPLDVTATGPTSTVAPGTSTTFTATVAGGLAPFNVTWQFGDGGAPAIGPVAAHTFAAPGTFDVVVLVGDAAGDLASANLTVLVRAVPLTVSIQPSSATGHVGSSLTFVANVAGGAPPFAYAWSAPAGICSGAKTSTLSCDPTSQGSLQVGVTVSDASGQSVSVALAEPIGTASGSGSATSPTPSPAGPALGSSTGSWVILLPVAVALAAALVIGGLMYVAGRRRARAQLANRPLCYAVPAWSETPAEFRSEPADGAPAESWARQP